MSYHMQNFKYFFQTKHYQDLKLLVSMVIFQFKLLIKLNFLIFRALVVKVASYFFQEMAGLLTVI